MAKQKGTFYTSLTVGTEGENKTTVWLESEMKLGNIIGYKRTPHTDYKGLSYESDFIVERNDNSKVFLEVKHLRGGYPTFVIEIYKDEIGTRPGWYRTSEAGHELRLIIIDRDTNILYIYDGNALQKKLSNYNGRLLQTEGNVHNPGYIVAIPWHNEALLAKYDLNKINTGILNNSRIYMKHTDNTISL